MVSIPETRELLLALALISGFVGATFVLDGSPSFSVNELVATPTPSREGRVLGASTHIMLQANPVVSIDVPEHNIFAPR